MQELLAELFVEIFYEVVIIGGIRLIKKGLRRLWYKIKGIKEPENPIDILAKKLLYKDIKLRRRINPSLTRGHQGKILEIIDQNNVVADFLDFKGNQIEYKNKIAFRLKMNEFRLINL